jgi:hypothetical protein
MVEIFTFIIGWIIPIAAGFGALVIVVKLIWGSRTSTEDAKKRMGNYLAGCIAIGAGIPIGSKFFSPLTAGIKTFLGLVLPNIPNLDTISQTVATIVCVGLFGSLGIASIQLLWGSEESTKASKQRWTYLLIGTISLFVLFAFGAKLFGMLKNPFTDAVNKLGL